MQFTLMESDWFPRDIMGMANEAVFPLPVSAQPKMSIPDKAIGIA